MTWSEDAKAIRTILLLWVLFGGGLVAWDVAIYERLATHVPFVATAGIVVERRCGPKGGYSAQYQADGRTLVASPEQVFLSGDCKYIDMGTHVTVWYSRSEPTYVSFVHPDQALSRAKGEIAFALFATVLGPLWLLLGPRLFPKG